MWDPLGVETGLSEWSLSASMMRDPRRAGTDRVVARRDDANCSEVKYRAVVLWIDSGIVAIPLFKVDVPSSSQWSGFSAEFSGSKPNDQLNAEKVFDHRACRHVRIFGR